VRDRFGCGLPLKRTSRSSKIPVMCASAHTTARFSRISLSVRGTAQNQGITPGGQNGKCTSRTSCHYALARNCAVPRRSVRHLRLHDRYLPGATYTTYLHQQRGEVAAGAIIAGNSYGLVYLPQVDSEPTSVPPAGFDVGLTVSMISVAGFAVPSGASEPSRIHPESGNGTLHSSLASWWLTEARAIGTRGWSRGSRTRTLPR
jgi:hypothetical protein